MSMELSDGCEGEVKVENEDDLTPTTSGHSVELLQHKHEESMIGSSHVNQGIYIQDVLRSNVRITRHS